MDNQNPVVENYSSQVYTAPHIDNPPPPSPKSFLSSKIVLLIVILLILFGTGGTYLALNSKPKSQTCTLEAKICSDGTSVGRTGPNCTFAPCPTKPTPTPDETANWKTYVNNQYGYSIKYPSDLVEFKQNRFFLIGDSGRTDTADGFGSELQILWRGNKPALQAAKEELSTRELKPTTINGYPGIEVVPSSNPDPNFARDFDYYLSPATNDKTIRITFSSQKYSKAISEESITKMREIALQILSTFKFLDSSPTPTCRPRPVCLDATPRCLIAETSDMCPPNSP